MAAPKVRTLHVEMLETRCLPSGNLGSTLLFTPGPGEDSTPALVSDGQSQSSADGRDTQSTQQTDSGAGQEDGSSCDCVAGQSAASQYSSDGESDGAPPPVVQAQPPAYTTPSQQHQQDGSGEDTSSRQSTSSTQPPSTGQEDGVTPPPVVSTSHNPVPSGSNSPGTTEASNESANAQAAAQPISASTPAGAADAEDEATTAQAAAVSASQTPQAKASTIVAVPRPADANAVQAAPGGSAESRPGLNQGGTVQAINTASGEAAPRVNVGPVASVMAHNLESAPQRLTPAQPLWISRPDNLDSQTLVAAPAETALPAYSDLLTDILPVDFSGVESSLKDFFAQLDELGLGLMQNQGDVLFSSAMVALATAVAVEISRRQMQPAVPALARGPGSIPYSDCV